MIIVRVSFQNKQFNLHDCLLSLFSSFCPTDTKFASSSDDGTVRIWDFMRCHEEKILRGTISSRTKNVQNFWTPRYCCYLPKYELHRENS